MDAGEISEMSPVKVDAGLAPIVGGTRPVGGGLLAIRGRAGTVGRSLAPGPGQRFLQSQDGPVWMSVRLPDRGRSALCGVVAGLGRAVAGRRGQIPKPGHVVAPGGGSCAFQGADDAARGGDLSIA